MNGKRLIVGSATLALVAGSVVMGGCATSSGAKGSQGGVTEEKQAVKPYAPEIAETSAESYAPKIDPANFVARVDNPYFPLKPGTTFIYEGKSADGAERIEVNVTHETKEILGVKCVVLRDRAFLNGELIEDTLDWHAQDKKGNVWYFGENTKEYENGKVVSTKGSWEAGVDGAKPGIIMEAKPQVGDSYRQEYLKGQAEDVAEVVMLGASASGLNDSVSTPQGSFENVVVTKDWSPLEPGLLEHKYYASGTGLIGEVDVLGGSDRIELVDVRTE